MSSAFLTQLFPNEGLRVFVTKELLAYKKKKVDMSILYVLCGPGSNGKSTFLEFVRNLIPCEVVHEAGEEGWNLWEAISNVGDKNIPIFVCVNSMKELDFLDSSDLWDRTHILPMYSEFVARDCVNAKEHRYLADTYMSEKMSSLVEDFLKENA